MAYTTMKSSVASNKDAILATYDNAGVLLNARRLGGMQDDGGSGIAYDHDDNLYVAGVFQGTINVEGQTLTGEKPSRWVIVAAGGLLGCVAIASRCC